MDTEQPKTKADDSRHGEHQEGQRLLATLLQLLDESADYDVHGLTSRREN